MRDVNTDLPSNNGTWGKLIKPTFDKHFGRTAAPTPALSLTMVKSEMELLTITIERICGGSLGWDYFCG